ncbi:hypothetical protein [Brevibacillus choshinensis]|uniref:hypothetical protein n=1 Tax=Brevibacillus choshinensis TaxID=54911 RepID=UPI002E1C7F16|nr:hypothetical protein [Brevibacillus choshinensis]
MNVKRILTALLACTLCSSAILVPAPALPVAEAAAPSYRITYKLPANPEKYLFLNVQMVSIANPQVPAMQCPYSPDDYIKDMDTGGSYWKLSFDNHRMFVSSKKGVLWNLYDLIGILPPHYPSDIQLDALDQRIDQTETYSEEGNKLRETRAQLQMNARLQPLIDAGYVLPGEIDDGVATKEFVANVLYRMFGGVRPYHGGIDLKDSDDVAVRWAVEVCLPGFVVDRQGYIYPESPLSMEPGPEKSREEYAYDRVFQFIKLVLPGKKTPTGWEYYQIKLLPGMVPMQPRDLILVNGIPYKSNDYGSDHYNAMYTAPYYNASKKIGQYFIPRFPQMLDQARKDALKPRVWDWSRDVIHHPKFAKQIAAYRKNKSSQYLNAVYQAVRKHYNLNIPQDSVANLKSVLDHVK